MVNKGVPQNLSTKWQGQKYYRNWSLEVESVERNDKDIEREKVAVPVLGAITNY